MTKEQFLNKWHFTGHNLILKDLEAVIAHEIAKVKEKPQPALNPIEQAYHAFQPIRYILWKKGWRIKKHSDTESTDANGRIFNNTCFVFDFDKNPQKWELCTEPEQPALNPIKEAYERGEKIRRKDWASEDWIKKISKTESIDENGKIWITSNHFKSIKTKPESWELYTEPTEQPAKPFDRDRFEAMFRAVVANGGHELDHKQAIELTEEALKQLDVYYASKEKGGNNE